MCVLGHRSARDDAEWFGLSRLEHCPVAAPSSIIPPCQRRHHLHGVSMSRASRIRFRVGPMQNRIHGAGPRSKEAARAKLAQMGLQPLALSADEAAALWGLSPGQFLKEVDAGNLPAAIAGLRCKRRLWSRLALEAAIRERDALPNDGRTEGDPLMNEIRARAVRSAVA